MPQNIPPFEFSDRAKTVRAFLYDYWCEHGHGPNLRAVHEATGLDRRRIIETYKELERGLIVVFDDTSRNASLLKVQPFSSYPSQVEVHLDQHFHAFAGCAMEATAVSRMPAFENKDLRLESFCACCFAPISLDVRNGELISSSVDADALRIHVSLSPWDWGNPNIESMCDSMNYVLDGSHATAYEAQTGRLGVQFTIDQARTFVAGTADNRMWDHNWPASQMNPRMIIKWVGSLGVDTTNWGS